MKKLLLGITALIIITSCTKSNELNVNDNDVLLLVEQIKPLEDLPKHYTYSIKSKAGLDVSNLKIHISQSGKGDLSYNQEDKILRFLPFSQGRNTVYIKASGQCNGEIIEKEDSIVIDNVFALKYNEFELAYKTGGYPISNFGVEDAQVASSNEDVLLIYRNGLTIKDFTPTWLYFTKNGVTTGCLITMSKEAVPLKFITSEIKTNMELIEKEGQIPVVRAKFDVPFSISLKWTGVWPPNSSYQDPLVYFEGNSCSFRELVGQQLYDLDDAQHRVNSLIRVSCTYCDVVTGETIREYIPYLFIEVIE